jgi:polyferredoxin
MCPQTVLDELYYWFDRKTRAWLRLPKAGKSGPGPVSGRGLAQRALVVAGSSALSLFVGFNLVAYFVDPYRMIAEAASLTLGPVTTACILVTAAIVLADILFWRERFCTKACPYGMLQAVITDPKTQIVRYQTERGEECIECGACVRDCMMGIDIRTSPYQTECIHCGDCVDSCARILGRLKEPLPTLITFSWGEKEAPKTTWYQKLGFVDAKRWAVLGLTAAYAVVLVFVIQGRQPLSITASGDRSTLYYVAEDGRIFNEYTVKISNRSMDGGWFTIRCESPQPGGDGCALNVDENPVHLDSREVRMLKMRIYTNGASMNAGPNRLRLVATDDGNAEINTSTEIVFFMPEKTVSESL